jgi:hypothetical protein
MPLAIKCKSSSVNGCHAIFHVTQLTSSVQCEEDVYTLNSLKWFTTTVAPVTGLLACLSPPCHPFTCLLVFDQSEPQFYNEKENTMIKYNNDDNNNNSTNNTIIT